MRASERSGFDIVGRCVALYTTPNGASVKYASGGVTSRPFSCPAMDFDAPPLPLASLPAHRAKKCARTDHSSDRAAVSAEPPIHPPSSPAAVKEEAKRPSVHEAPRVANPLSHHNHYTGDNEPNWSAARRLCSPP
ncbi:hypothetical protein MRX96_026074 [Rhipicephalus microplus]